MRRKFWILVLLGAAAGCTAVSLRATPYKGWAEALVLEAPDSRTTAVVVPEAGGRIVSFSKNGTNILFENVDYLGKTLAGSAPGALDQGYIGYNCDIGPELRRIPKHLPLWMGPYSWRKDGTRVVLASAPDPSVGIQIEKTVSIDPRTGALDLSQTLTNTSNKPQSYCVWDRTLCQGGGYALVPLASRSRFPSGWSLLRDGVYEGTDARHPAVTVEEGVLVVHAEGNATKLGADPDRGWVAYVRDRLLIVKYFPVERGGTYSDGGNVVELYFDPRVCELEPLSPEVTLSPNARYSFPERWILIELDRPVTSPKEARSAVDQIPPSPFGR